MYKFDDATRKRLLEDALVEHLLEKPQTVQATRPAPAPAAAAARPQHGTVKAA